MSHLHPDTQRNGSSDAVAIPVRHPGAALGEPASQHGAGAAFDHIQQPRWPATT
jgi:hypothetical protein